MMERNESDIAAAVAVGVALLLPPPLLLAVVSVVVRYCFQPMC